MDEEGMQIDIADALGKSAAAVCMMSAVVSMLAVKGLLNETEIATATGVASQTLAVMEGLSSGARELGQAALRGYAKVWTKQVTKN